MKRASKLSELIDSHDNNFNLIRLIAALVVLIAHSFTLVTGNREFEPVISRFGKSIGSVAVDFFFVASGLLITASLFRRPNMVDYAVSRALRIFPALVAANLFCLLILGPIFTQIDLKSYFSSLETFKFLVKNTALLFGLQYQLPGVFVENPFSYAVNGSLWTLPHELRMYILIAVIFCCAGAIAKNKKIAFMAVFVPMATASALILCLLSKYSGYAYLHGLKWPWLMFLFFSGSSIYLYREKIELSHAITAILLIALLFSVVNRISFGVVYSLVIPYVVIYLAYVPGGYIRKYNAFGDYSYGLYIYAFPIQQSLISIFPNIGIYGMIFWGFLITLIFAILSWNYVEKPLLSKKKSVSIFVNGVLNPNKR